MGTRLSLDSWFRASNEVIESLPGVFKLVGDLLIGRRDHAKLAERVERLLQRCQDVGIILASNKIQVGKKVSFAGYIMDGSAQYRDPMKVDGSHQDPQAQEHKGVESEWACATSNQ